MKYLMVLLLIPSVLYAQEFEFRQELDSIPLEIAGFQPHQPWAGGDAETCPNFCDIDADGDLDLFVGSFWGKISLFENVGTAQQAQYQLVTREFAGVNISGDPYHGRTDPQFCDLDGDGDYDLFGGNYGQISLFQNDGTPLEFNFNLITGAFESVDVGDKASPEFVDIDADGDEDLFIGNEEGKIWYYRNDGDSLNYSFTYVTDYFDSIDVGDIASPEFADIDGDGDYDLFIGEENNGPFFYENVGNSEIPHFRFITSDYLTLDLGYPVDEPQVVDINGDGALDLIIDLPSTLAYFENRGSSQNPDFLHITDTFQGISLTSICPYFVDIDADTDYDLFCGQAAIPGPPSLALYLNYGTPQQPNIQLYDPQFITNPNFWVFIVPGLADIDADGDYDLFISDNDGHFFYYQNYGSSISPDFILESNQWQGIQFFYPYDGSKGFSFVDLDEDGDLDLLMTSAYPVNLSFYRNEGNPQTANMVLETEEFLEEYTIYTPYPYLVDIDSDSDMDLFIGELNGGIMFFRNVTGEPPAVPPVVVSPYRGPVLTLGPNPANPVTWVTFNLPTPQKATLAVYNLLGQKVATLAQGLQPAGTHTYLWNASQAASGVYIVRLEMDKEAQVGKVVVMR